jgi:hypothetical protein
MRLLLVLILVVYCVGVGVELAPVFDSGWNHLPASDLASSVVHDLRDALA